MGLSTDSISTKMEAPPVAPSPDPPGPDPPPSPKPEPLGGETVSTQQQKTDD